LEIQKVVKDFDEALKADKKEQLQIKVAGKEYDLPAALPAKTVLTQMRYAGESGDTVPMNMVPEWIASLVGQDNFDSMLEDGMTWTQMNDLLVYLLEAYGLQASADELAGEAEDEEGDEDSPK
tara:strand:- start:1899 stop:2267 length:369 start_codon:yes stop_codon:yes gene_type:complete